MLIKLTNYCFQPMAVGCDGNCSKAWGINSRPITESGNEWLSDSELETAPIDPGTYEGGCGKPKNESDYLNKWCVRECERCGCAHINDIVTLVDFSKRVER